MAAVRTARRDPCPALHDVRSGVLHVVAGDVAPDRWAVRAPDRHAVGRGVSRSPAGKCAGAAPSRGCTVASRRRSNAGSCAPPIAPCALRRRSPACTSDATPGRGGSSRSPTATTAASAGRRHVDATRDQIGSVSDRLHGDPLPRFEEVRIFLEGVERLVLRRPELAGALDIAFYGEVTAPCRAVADRFIEHGQLAGVIRFAGFVPCPSPRRPS